MMAVAWRGDSGWWWWRVEASEVVGRVDPVVRTIFGFDRKIPPEKFSGGGGRNPVAEGGRRWGGMRGERERVDKDVSGKTERIRIGNGVHTCFWKDFWIGDTRLQGMFPRLYALESYKDISVADKIRAPLYTSFRRDVRGGAEASQLAHLSALLATVTLSQSEDRWTCDLNGEGVFRVKDVRNLLDEHFLPNAGVPTRWIKYVPIKVNIFAWKVFLDRLPTRLNLAKRNVVTESLSCPLCDSVSEDTSHLLFRCNVARDVTDLICRWWNLGVQDFLSYTDWLEWFHSVRLGFYDIMLLGLKQQIRIFVGRDLEVLLDLFLKYKGLRFLSIMGIDDWHEVTRKKHGYSSKEDDLAKISISVYIMNFPDSCSAKDLFQSCKVYGHVVDSYIPFKSSKSGKRFGFVRFINVFSVERLISNLFTLWIGKHRLLANVTRFQRPPVNVKASAPFGGNAQPINKEVKDPLPRNNNSSGQTGRSSHFSNPGMAKQPKVHTGSYANVVSGAQGPLISPSPALVLEDSCLVERDLSRHVMGKVKDFSSIPNLYTILIDEGFSGAKLTYMGGTWVMIEFDKVDTKELLMNHSGIKSWFLDIKDAVDEFVSEDRIIWMDIEGVPLKAWSRETFIKIGKKWGETLDLEDNSVFMLRHLVRNNGAISIKRKDCNSDGESVIEPLNNNDNEEEFDDEYASDVNEVPETVLGANSSSNIRSNGSVAVHQSDDPFGLYDLLNKKKAGETRKSSPSLSHPPGFTPEILEDQNDKEAKDTLESLNAKVMGSSQEIPIVDHNDQVSQKGINNGGSVLGVMEDVIRVGQAMGYSMEGCTKKEWVKALTSNYKLNFLAIQETKMSKVSHMDVRFMWGNNNYDFVCSDSLGNSGGILCIWEATVFKKENVTISDNFIAIYGSWLPNNAKILFIAVYAPQQASSKAILWDYISVLLTRWNGETIVMGDFNEVRSSEERRGSCFNPYSARRFDRFILTSGLVDIKLEGYTFTWSHPSATKMSKLDRFLVSDGIYNLFPSITAICLDRHISDHRPILLREVKLDFGPTPFLCLTKESLLSESSICTIHSVKNASALPFVLCLEP
ncbi:RNA-directed DNA polymerase, eukaryota [Tanacetum coccineum]